MIDTLREIKLKTFEYKKTGTFVLKGVDQVQQKLDDNFNILLMMKSSPYIKPILVKANTSEAKLIMVTETLDGWMKCQRSWMYLEPIFASDNNKVFFVTKNIILDFG